MNKCYFAICLCLLVLGGCNSGDTPIETYKPAPGQITDPNAMPAQAAPKDSSDAIKGLSNLPPAARDALTRQGNK